MNFDSEYLEAVDITGNTGGYEGLKEIDNDTGTIRYQYCIHDNNLSNNVLAKVTFEVIEVGITEVSIDKTSMFSTKPEEDDMQGGQTIEVDYDSSSDYTSSVTFTAGTVAAPKFVYDKTVFPYSMEVSFEWPDDGVKIYYTTRDGTEPKAEPKYEYDEPFEISNTTTVTAFAEKIGIKSRMVSQRFRREMGGMSGGGGSYSPVVSQPFIPHQQAV